MLGNWEICTIVFALSTKLNAYLGIRRTLFENTFISSDIDDLVPVINNIYMFKNKFSFLCLIPWKITFLSSYSGSLYDSVLIISIQLLLQEMSISRISPLI